MARVRALDGLRGVAVLAVLLFHNDLLTGGYLGVDLFFVLSGYLITSLLLMEAQSTGSVHLLAFWSRRARRLLPAMSLILIAAALYAAVFAQPDELIRIRGDGLATLGEVANWRLIYSHIDYWAQFRAPSPLLHTWSLAIEEQFYLVWPIVVLGVLGWGRRRRGPSAPMARQIFFLSVALAVAGSAWAGWVWRSEHDGVRIYFGTDTRSPALLLGGALAAWTLWRGPVRGARNRVLLELAGGVGVVVLTFAWLRLDGDRLFRGGLLLCSLAAVVLIASAAHPTPGVIARALSFTPLVGLGIISYGVYLWHWPIYLVLNADRTGLTGWTLFALRLPVTVTVAIASYVLVERPIRLGRITTPHMKLIAPALGACLVALMLLTTAGADTGSPGRSVLPDPEKVARRAKREKAERIMIAGNSVANLLAEDGFARVRANTPIAVLNDGLYSCDFPPATFVRDKHELKPARPLDCTTAWRHAVTKFDPQVVILIFGDVHVTDYRFGDGWTSPCEPSFRPHYRAALDRTVAQLSAHGAHVVLTTAAYSLFLSTAAYNEVRDTTRCTNTLVREYALTHPKVGLVDVQAYLCPSEEKLCLTKLDGADLRPDGVHYQRRGAQLLAAWILNQIGIDAHAPR